MNCSQISIENFIFDRMEEPAREQTREHLIVCENCRSSAVRLEPNEPHLFHMSALPMDFNFSEALLESKPAQTLAARVKSRLGKTGTHPKKPERSPIQMGAWMIGGTFLLVSILIWQFTANYQSEMKKPVYLRLKRKLFQATGTSPLKQHALPSSFFPDDSRPVIIDMAEIRAEDISLNTPPPSDGPPAGKSGSQSNVWVINAPEPLDPALQEKPDPEQSQREVQAIRPLHIHLRFKTHEARAAFLTDSARLSIKTPLLAQDFAILTMDYDHLNKLFHLIQKNNELKRTGSSLSAPALPKFKDPAQISLVLDAADSDADTLKFLEWHLLFHLSNRLVFNEELKQAGFRFQYETPELWVLEMTPDEFYSLLKMKASCKGLVVQMGQRAMPATSSTSPIRIILYIKDI